MSLRPVLPVSGSALGSAAMRARRRKQFSRERPTIVPVEIATHMAMRSSKPSPLLATLRDASWLTRRRVRDYATILIAVYAIAILWGLSGRGINDPLGRPVGTDFLSFWTVSAALHRGETGAIYAAQKLAALEQIADPANDRFYAWAYPPSALLVVYPLAALPYLWSLGAWLAVGLVGYLTALWRILPNKLTIWAGLAFPAVFVEFSHGQNGLLAAGLLGWALILLPQRPYVAGLLIGALTFKPQLGLVIPFALAAGGHWRTIAVAAVTALALAALPQLLLGSALWSDFVASLPYARSMLELPLVAYYKMQSVFAAARLLGATVSFAYLMQGLAAVAAVSVTIWAWRQPAAQELKNAVLVVAGLVATPFVLDYDLTLLALAAAWLVARGLEERALPWERTILVAVCLVPLASRLVAQLSGVVVAPLAEAALLVVLVRRIRLEPSPIATGRSKTNGPRDTRPLGQARYGTSSRHLLRRRPT
jgi:alpha-1,2-mannosyltransferase